MAIKDLDNGTKILIGLGLFALLIGMLSRDPDNDAWGGTSAGDADADQGSGETDVDAWTGPTATDAGAEPSPAPCVATAPFRGEEGTVVLPSDGPLATLASPECVLDERTGGGPAVARLQLALSVCHDQPVAVDGIYGVETRRAVAAVQGDLWLEPDGVYGPETARSMRWPLGAGAGDAAGACGPPPR